MLVTLVGSLVVALVASRCVCVPAGLLGVTLVTGVIVSPSLVGFLGVDCFSGSDCEFVSRSPFLSLKSAKLFLFGVREA